MKRTYDCEMGIAEIILVAVGLGMDAMSVCMAVGVRWHGSGQKLRLALSMGLFQLLMPLAGWLAGSRLAHLLTNVGAYVAGGLVFAVGAKMLYEALRSHPGAAAEETGRFIEEHIHVHPKDPTRGWSLLLLSVATSLDALVVGFSMGLHRRHIWLVSVIIGITAALMALLGVSIGKRVGKAFGRPAECIGACVLMILGVSFLCMG